MFRYFNFFYQSQHVSARVYTLLQEENAEGWGVGAVPEICFRHVKYYISRSRLVHSSVYRVKSLSQPFNFDVLFRLKTLLVNGLLTSPDWVLPVTPSPVIMASIAGFLAYNVQALPPGIHPAPSGVLALWEIILTDTVKCRAIEMIQKVWRDKMMRVVAKVQVGMAQKER